MVKVVRRDCTEDTFQKEKISNAILKAMKNGSGIVKPKIAEDIAEEIYNEVKDNEEVSISEIESLVYDKLISKKQRLTAKAYEGYRSIREFQRDNQNTTDEEISELLAGNSDYWQGENSNKNPRLNTTQRDYMAGIVSTDMTRRYLLPPEIVQAHDEGILHFHDADYFGQPMHNCFSGDTRFITSEGIKSFVDFSDGDTVYVMDRNGIFREATVKKYGKQKMYDVVFTAGRREKMVTCTKNHRWILKNGTVTTDLQVGDVLLGVQNITQRHNPTNFDEYNTFALGFLIGDGCDHKGSNRHQIRLCGEKVQYKDILEKAGYRIETIKDSKDLIAYKRGYKKQDFLDGKSWRYLDARHKALLFYGLYAADGSTNCHKLSTTDKRIAELVREVSSVGGYFITSESVEVRDTEYKKNSELITFRFALSQPENLCWKVKSIIPHDMPKQRPMDAWCVVEPTTHSFILENGMITGNCDLVNLEDMLQNNTVISETLIEKPHSFSTACNIATQIIAQVASAQYGGQSISLAHLAPFVDVSRQKIRKEVEADQKAMFKMIEGGELVSFSQKMQEAIDEITEERLKNEIRRGIQTIQYQVVTLMTTNGQAPFLTVFMYLNEAKTEREKTDLAMLIEETLKQRCEGVKNEQGVWITPAFPKLIYVLEEDNITEDSKYWYLTELAAKCSAKRLVPDYISEKVMLENKIDKNGVGHCYTCMG